MEEFFEELRGFIIENTNNEFKEIYFKYKLQTGETEEYKLTLSEEQE